jgi:uncharacterized protein
MQLLLLGLIVLLGYFYLKKLLKNYQLSRNIKETKAVQNMVRCGYCDVFLPESEALTEGRGNFCCREHRELARKGS